MTALDPDQPSAPPLDNTSRHRVKAWLRQGVSVAISVTCLVLIFRHIDLVELRGALTHFRWHFLMLGLLSLAIDYALRILRWAVMLRATGANITTRACVAPFLGSIALNNVLPFRAGDIIRIFVFPAVIGVSRTTAAASVLFERLVDLLSLLLSLGVGLLINSTAVPKWIGETATTLAVVGVVMLLAIMALSRPLAGMLRRLGERGACPAGGAVRATPPLMRAVMTAAELVEQLGQMSRLDVGIALLLLSLFIWIGESGLFWTLLLGLGVAAGPGAALIVMACATIATLVPSSPGYVGPFHLAAYSAVVALGGVPAQAASFAVLAHLGLWIPTTLVGGLAILTHRRLFERRAAAAV